jgi:RNA polymerase sigma factor (TIGR02999 family)
MSRWEQKNDNALTAVREAAHADQAHDVKSAASSSVTELLDQVRGGNTTALSGLMALLYRELHRLARRRLFTGYAGHSLRTSDLINETYLKLVSVRAPAWKDRGHFLAVASSAMRSILVDYARRRSYAKRGGDATRVSLSHANLCSDEPRSEVLAIDEALARLSELCPRKSQIVELRYFAGFSIEETAEVMSLSTGTVKREWNMARAWLRRELARRDVA